MSTGVRTKPHWLKISGTILLFLLLGGFILLPFIQMLVLSFTSTLPREGIVQGGFSLVNFRNIMVSELLSGSIINSIIYVKLYVLVTILVALPAANGISRFSFTGDRHVFLMLIAFRITPPVVLTLPVFILFAKVGLVNSPVGIAWSTVCSIFPLQSGYWKVSSPPCRRNWTRPAVLITSRLCSITTTVLP